MRIAVRLLVGLALFAGAVAGLSFVLNEMIEPPKIRSADTAIRSKEEAECHAELTSLANEIASAEEYAARAEKQQIDTADLRKEIETAHGALAEKRDRLKSAKEHLDVYGAGVQAWHQRLILNHHANRVRLKLGKQIVVIDPIVDRIDESDRSRLSGGDSDHLRFPETVKLGREAESLKRCYDDADRMLLLAKHRDVDTTALEAALSDARRKYPDPMKAAQEVTLRNSWSAARSFGRSLWLTTSNLQFYVNEHRLLNKAGMMLLTPNYNQLWPLEERSHLLD